MSRGTVRRGRAAVRSPTSHRLLADRSAISEAFPRSAEIDSLRAGSNFSILRKSDALYRLAPPAAWLLIAAQSRARRCGGAGRGGDRGGPHRPRPVHNRKGTCRHAPRRYHLQDRRRHQRDRGRAPRPRAALARRSGNPNLPANEIARMSASLAVYRTARIGKPDFGTPSISLISALGALLKDRNVNAWVGTAAGLRDAINTDDTRNLSSSGSAFRLKACAPGLAAAGIEVTPPATHDARTHLLSRYWTVRSTARQRAPEEDEGYPPRAPGRGCKPKPSKFLILNEFKWLISAPRQRGVPQGRLAVGCRGTGSARGNGRAAKPRAISFAAA